MMPAWFRPCREQRFCLVVRTHEADRRPTCRALNDCVRPCSLQNCSMILMTLQRVDLSALGISGLTSVSKKRWALTLGLRSPVTSEDPLSKACCILWSYLDHQV